MATPPDFVSGQILTAAQMNAVGLWLVKTQTVGTGVSSVTVTDAFSSTYDNYKVTLTGGVGSTGQSIALTLGASATGYYSGSTGTNYGSDSLQYLRDNNATSWQYAGGSFTNGNAMDVTLYNPGLASRTGIAIQGRIDYRTVGANTQGTGFHDSATAYTAFTLTVTGTMTGGTIRVYGYRN
jgi:hypothetical protein